MPFAFLIVGVIAVAAGVNHQSKQLLTLVKGDLQGKDGYIYWFISILLIGSLGYIPQLKGFSRAFLVLVLLVLVLKEGNPQSGGFFAKFTSALAQISNPVTASQLQKATSTNIETNALPSTGANVQFVP